MNPKLSESLQFAMEVEPNAERFPVLVRLHPTITQRSRVEHLLGTDLSSDAVYVVLDRAQLADVAELDSVKSVLLSERLTAL